MKKGQWNIKDSILDPQLWTMIGSKLINKEGLWTSNDDWEVLEKEDTKICIVNSKHQALSAKHNSVKERVLEQDNLGQLWKKGVPNSEGYFTLTSVTSPKVLTASPAKKLEVRAIIKGQNNLNCVIMLSRETVLIKTVTEQI